MLSPSRSHAFLHCLPYALLSFCLMTGCHMACAQSPKPTGPPKNGQYGTPNLPNAISNFVDWNRMRGQADNVGGNAETNAHVFKQALSITYTNLLSGNADLKTSAYSMLSNLLGQLQSLQSASPSDKLHSIYAGIETRGGSGRTDYFVPTVVYSNELAGYDVGTDIIIDARNRSHYSSLGLSFRYEVTDQGRALAKEIATNSYSTMVIHQKLLSLITPIAALLSDKKNKIPLEKGNANLQLLLNFQLDSDPKPLSEPSTKVAGINAQILNMTTQVSALADAVDHLSADVVSQSISPALSVFAGSRLINGSGSITSEGFSASKLFPFGKGLPGVTLLYVVQGVYASLSPGYTQGGVQNGAAIILQDRTPATNDNYLKTGLSETTDPTNTHSDKTYSDLLRPPWKIKVGVEYITPALGLSKTYTGFVRYRDPSSYAEITLAFGEDGTGKNYGSLSIGRSFLF